MPARNHTPVLLREAIEILKPSRGETILDCTLGLGGHAKAFLERVGDEGKLIGIDADEKNLETAREALTMLSGEKELHHGNFSELQILSLPKTDIIFADLGLSSPHVDDPSRGFTFREEGPLDLRYDQSRGNRASDLIAFSSEEQLASIFRHYGELYKEARRLGEKLASKQFETTTSLRSEIETLFGFRAKQILPQIFQALRIAVNGELDALKSLLEAGPLLLRPGGRMGVISYHSLEDRLVKHAFRVLSTPEKDEVTGKISKAAPFELLTKKALLPSAREIADNPRARSAKFRAIRRL